MVKFYTFQFQNGKSARLSTIVDNALYNKIMSDVGSSSSKYLVPSGSGIGDLQAYFGNQIFDISFPLQLTGSPNSRQQDFLNAFRNVKLVDNFYDASVHIDTHGQISYSGNAGITEYAGYTTTSSPTPLASYAPWTRSDSDIIGIIFYGIMSSSLLDGVPFAIQFVHDYYGWFAQYSRINGASSWRDVLPQTFINWFEGYMPDEPFSPGGYSEEGGGIGGNFSEDSDEVEADPLPDETNFGATSCGLITIFHPTKNQLKKLADVIWGKGFLNFLQNLVENISDLFISLGMLPFSVTHGNTVEVTWFSYDVGGDVPVGTGIYLDLAPNQWLEFQMGGVALDGADSRIFSSDSVLDYSPYSKLGIYLPFIGYQELDIDECRGQTLYLTYRVDVLSGTCVALLTLNSYDEDRTIYEFTGNCLTQLPLTSMDAQSLITNAVNIGIAISSAGATEAVASAGDALAQSAFQASGGELGVDYDRMQHAFAANAAKVSNAQNSLLSSTVNGVMGMKPNFKKSGAVSASATLMAVKQPYLFLVTPRQSFPENYGHFCGYPCNIADTLGNFSGFTVVEDIRLNGLVATSPEVEEIYKLLKTGVII